MNAPLVVAGKEDLARQLPSKIFKGYYATPDYGFSSPRIEFGKLHVG